jgi:hypothetical protein
LHATPRRRYPASFETVPGEPAERNRIRISVSSNAPGHVAALPYTRRVMAGLPMHLRITRHELETMAWDGYEAHM